MAILVDLDEEDGINRASHRREHDDHHEILRRSAGMARGSPTPASASRRKERANPNLNSFSAALSCYPVVSQIARHLDLNSLHDLSATCRQFRANLLQYRSQLIKLALRCTNEEVAIGPRLGDRMRESHAAWNGSVERATFMNGRMTSGRVGKCARDMVGECRRCGVVVCRNCTIKKPSTTALTERHRRLCRTCITVPIRCHTAPLHGYFSTTPVFTSPAFERTPCTCASSVHICVPCGRTLGTTDMTYMRGWTWRTRYSTLFGLGTGIGEGNEGVECGKGSFCLASREVEKEIDCDADELAELNRELAPSESPVGGRRASGYLMQEIEGIGGVVKKKVKRRVRVGAAVKEYEDERESADFLGRERVGQNRSWCAWCLCVIPGVKSKDMRNMNTGDVVLEWRERNSSSSSGQSE